MAYFGDENGRQPHSVYEALRRSRQLVTDLYEETGVINYNQLHSSKNSIYNFIRRKAANNTKIMDFGLTRLSFGALDGVVDLEFENTAIDDASIQHVY